MKERLSVTVDSELIKNLDEILQNKEFRNKSHLVELALVKFMKEKEDGI